MTSFGDAFARFDAELDAAVSRARRVSAEARADSAAFRAETAKLAEATRNRSLVARPDELTSKQLREQAVKFRDEQGLPVEPLPSAEELVQAGMVREERPVRPPAEDEDDDFSQEKIMSASTTRDEPPGEEEPRPPVVEPPVAPARGRRRPVPRTSDDDDDFSQERILFEG
ncbi:hypothetical protein [Labedaea rhizosphaerae]|uniref:Uncharacterized protein n=1 Tax=Labedaea rhizosphaerae TaxID=598644 RepID=A0A4R6SMM2_LABRH|nr:hypothetical protein [Labedaea rhizosphaerae]TDQ05776.1 hypothetical protein EV186_1011754 [Labedaea rhizosphaerae]